MSVPAGATTCIARDPDGSSSDSSTTGRRSSNSTHQISPRRMCPPGREMAGGYYPAAGGRNAASPAARAVDLGSGTGDGAGRCLIIWVVTTRDDLLAAAGPGVDPGRWLGTFDELMTRAGARFSRVEPRRRARAFVLGLLAELPRRNCWTIAEHAGDRTPDGMQHLLSRARRDAGGVRDDVRGLQCWRRCAPTRPGCSPRPAEDGEAAAALSARSAPPCTAVRECAACRSARSISGASTHPRSKAARIAAVRAASCAGSRYPIRSPMAIFAIVTILSQFTTESWSRPLACPTGISTDRPRAVDVIGATVICVRSGMTSSRVSTRTGRALSRRAIWIGLTDPGPRDARRGIARDQPCHCPRLIGRR